MGNFSDPLRNLGRMAANTQVDHALRHSCLGRIASMVTGLVIILCMGLWVGIFLLVGKTGLAKMIPENMISVGLGIAFFGGILIAIIIGGLVGNALRRIFWGILRRRR